MSEAINHRCLEWMPKSVWGPIKWRELHCRALTSLPMTNEREWFDCFLEGLPCVRCRAHFEEFLSREPPDFQARRSFFEWTVRAHNHVNASNGKPLLTIENALDIHQEMIRDCAEVTSENNKT